MKTVKYQVNNFVSDERNGCPKYFCVKPIPIYYILFHLLQSPVMII